jgi:hypothetical protein
MRDATRFGAALITAATVFGPGTSAVFAQGTGRLFPSGWRIERTADATVGTSPRGHSISVSAVVAHAACAEMAADEARSIAGSLGASARFRRYVQSGYSIVSVLSGERAWAIGARCRGPAAVLVVGTFPPSNDPGYVDSALRDYADILERGATLLDDADRARCPTGSPYHPGPGCGDPAGATSAPPVVGTWSTSGGGASVAYYTELTFTSGGAVRFTFPGIRQEGTYVMRGADAHIAWIAVRGARPGSVPPTEVCRVTIVQTKLTVAECGISGDYWARIGGVER